MYLGYKCVGQPGLTGSDRFGIGLHSTEGYRSCMGLLMKGSKGTSWHAQQGPRARSCSH